MKYFDMLVESISDITEISATIIRPFLGTIIIILVAKSFKIIISAMIRDFSDNKNKIYDRNHYIGIIIDVLTILLITLFLGRYISNMTLLISLITSSLTFALRDIFVCAFYGAYIKKHKTFKLEDRIEIDGIKGDVINIGRLSFDLLQVGNDNASQSTGVIITIPNSFAATKHIKNYNKGFKYIWEELHVHISRDADIDETKKSLYSIVNNIAEIENVSNEIKNDLDDMTSDYRIYYNNCDPIIYINVFDRYIDYNIRYLCDVKKIRNIEDNLWQEIITADKKGNIKLYKES